MAFELDEFFLGHYLIRSDCRLRCGDNRCCGRTERYDAGTQRRRSRLEPCAAARVDLACAARCHGPAAAVRPAHGQTAAPHGSGSSMAELVAEPSDGPSPE